MLYSITGNALLCRAMPRYYFHLRGSGARDTEGQEFPNEEVAREEARAVARDLSRNKAVTTHELLVVTDANGKVIHEEPLFR
ncbi:MAG: hypothetical protein WAK36_22860 [Pseudolabrys sp.]|jgi:hypothetical protein|nr:hypothetical protein [Pseudolabrys sp.]